MGRRPSAAPGGTTRSGPHLPAEDFWIFDSRLVAALRCDDEDVFHDVEIITEPAEVLRYCQVRDAAGHDSVPYDTFAAQLGTKG